MYIHDVGVWKIRSLERDWTWFWARKPKWQQRTGCCSKQENVLLSAFPHLTVSQCTFWSLDTSSSVSRNFNIHTTGFLLDSVSVWVGILYIDEWILAAICVRAPGNRTWATRELGPLSSSKAQLEKYVMPGNDTLYIYALMWGEYSTTGPSKLVERMFTNLWMAKNSSGGKNLRTNQTVQLRMRDWLPEYHGQQLVVKSYDKKIREPLNCSAKNDRLTARMADRIK